MKQLTILALLGIAACGGSKANGGGGAAAEGQGQATGSGGATVETAQWPSDPCSWISQADVEAVIGKLAGAPHPADGGCLYPVPMNEETAKRRAAAEKLGELAKKLAEKEGTTLEPMKPPPDPAYIVDVSIDVANTGERALRKVETIAARMLETDSLTVSKPASAEWDYSQSPIAFGLAGFMGRMGQLTIMVRVEGTSYEEKTLEALAAAVRDRVPDKPFGPRSGQFTRGQSSGPDPCALVTVAEAEAVLGKLTFPPYRTAETTAHPDPGGDVCVYRTAHHHVLRVKPVWSDAKFDMKLTKGVGGLIGMVMPGANAEAADTLEGPWDEVVLDNATGDYLFRVGERAIQISFGTSSTDAKGALKLVPTALGRLKAAQ